LKVPSFNDSKLKLILISVSIRIVSSVTSSENNAKTETVHNSSFLKSNEQSIAMLLTLYMILLFYFMFDRSIVSSSNKDLKLLKIEYSVEESHFFLFALFDENAFSESCICDILVCKIQ